MRALAGFGPSSLLAEVLGEGWRTSADGLVPVEVPEPLAWEQPDQDLDTWLSMEAAP